MLGAQRSRPESGAAADFETQVCVSIKDMVLPSASCRVFLFHVYSKSVGEVSTFSGSCGKML